MVAGLEPENTNAFLQMLARAVASGDGADAVQRVLGGESMPTEGGGGGGGDAAAPAAAPPPRAPSPAAAPSPDPEPAAPPPPQPADAEPTRGGNARSLSPHRFSLNSSTVSKAPLTNQCLTDRMKHAYTSA